MSGAIVCGDTLDWQYAHILWQKRGLRMEEWAEMPDHIKAAYIASEKLAQEHPLDACDRLAKVYIKTK